MSETSHDRYLTAQREICTAARVVRDSTVLSEFDRDETPVEWNYLTRAEIALAYVQNVHYKYATGEDFDKRFVCVSQPDNSRGGWRVFADDTADELLGENVDNARMLSRYFDYESFARDLKYDYDVVTFENTDAVIVFSS